MNLISVSGVQRYAFKSYPKQAMYYIVVWYRLDGVLNLKSISRSTPSDCIKDTELFLSFLG